MTSASPSEGAPDGPAPEGLDAVLQARFQLAAFRPWQREAIGALLEGPGRVLVVAPTGGGKSLTYQLPAVMLPGTTLVVSPLVALMEDQVRALDERGIPATYLASTVGLEERRRRESAFLKGAYKLVYVAPERLASEAFVSMLTRARIDLVAIDEAHCIAQWGHDFRPDYLRIGALLARLAPRRVLACTATATPEVRREIRHQLGFTPEHSAEVLRGFARPNLHLEAQSVEGPREARRALEGLLHEALGKPSRPKGGAIVYAATRRGTEQWTAQLQKAGWSAGTYHAGLDADARSRVARAFADRSLDVVVATNAFGMGIDRSDIRAVIHVQPPASIEAYYQEVGRAGRDGDEAHGLLLCSGADIALRRRLCESGGEGAAADPEMAARAWGLFRGILRYLDARSCRHDFVLRYFGDEKELLGGCGHCDVCAERAAVEEAAAASGEGAEAPAEAATLLVRKALSGIARAQRRSGLLAIADMLRGVDDERTRRFGFTRLSTFGLLSDRSKPWVLSLMRALIAAGCVDLTPTEHPVPYLTRLGEGVMRATVANPVSLPLELVPRGARAPGAPPSTSRPVREAGGPSPDVAALDPDARARFERLRACRAALARDRKVPAYVVAFDRTLVELAQRRPQSREALGDIYGFGPSRIERYGDDFLQVLTSV